MIGISSTKNNITGTNENIDALLEIDCTLYIVCEVESLFVEQLNKMLSISSSPQ